MGVANGWGMISHMEVMKALQTVTETCTSKFMYVECSFSLASSFVIECFFIIIILIILVVLVVFVILVVLVVLSFSHFY